MSNSNNAIEDDKLPDNVMAACKHLVQAIRTGVEQDLMSAITARLITSKIESGTSLARVPPFAEGLPARKAKPKAKSKARAMARATRSKITPDDVFTFLKNNGAAGVEAVAAGFKTKSSVIKPIIARLRKDGAISVQGGKARSTVYGTV